MAVVVPSRTPGRSALTDGVEVVHLRAGLSFLSRFYRGGANHLQLPDPLYVRSLKRFLKEWQPDIVHSHGHAVFSAGIALGGRTPWIHTIHDYGLLCPKATLWKLPEGTTCENPMTLSCVPCHAREEPTGWFSPLRPMAILPALSLSRSRLPPPDQYIAVSEFVAESHRRFFPRVGDKITVIPNFLPQDGTEVDSCAGLPEEPFVLFAGSAAAQKGVHILLEAFRSIPENVRLVLMAAGPASWLDPLRSKADDRTIFYHNAPHDLVMAAWKRALFGVVPSLWPDPCPTVAFEAMSYSKPVVASAIGGLPEIVADGVTGILVPPGDAGLLGQAIGRLIENEALRIEMGRKGRERFRQEFSAEVVVPKIEEAYLDTRAAKVASR